MSLHVSDSYAQTVDKASWSHAHGRDVFHLLPSDIEAARLFSYAYRSQTIGTFHATRVALEARSRDGGSAQNARELLAQLANKATEGVPRDFRCLLATFHSYHRWVTQVIEGLESMCVEAKCVELESIREAFLRNIEPITAGDGIYVARDLTLPQQGAFTVPNLGISIAPLIYGDHHSWNAAFLDPVKPMVAVHRHQKGAEIHLGFSPVQGRTILGPYSAEISEGYAMPIPPMTDHGFINASGHDHVVPFIFGSLLMSGWGIFFDVEPRGDQLAREHCRLDSPEMNGSVFLDRAIARMLKSTGNLREVLIAPRRAGSPEIGGLELALSRVSGGEIELSAGHYRIVSIRHGRGRVRMGGASREVQEHDHFGIPADLVCHLGPSGTEPLVFLEAMILPISVNSHEN